MVEKYAGMSKNVSEQSSGAIKDLRGSDSMKSMEHSLRVRIPPVEFGTVLTLNADVA